MTDMTSSPRPATPTTGPITATERITSLDTIRGIAILGILPMNALIFGLDNAAYNNLSADGLDTFLDGVVGVLTLLFIDQKMMALFSLLFGVGVVIFAERAAAKGRRVVSLSLWRFALLLAVGVVHAMFWVGDILVVYAVSAPIVLLVRRLPTGLLATAGVALALAGSFAAPFVQATVGADGAELGEYWFAGGAAMSPAVETWFGLDAVGRALGLMLLGVVLYRLGIVQGDRDDAYYRRLAGWGLAVGTAITVVGIVIRSLSGWSPDVAIVGHIPTGLGTLPMALGYLALIVLFDRSSSRHLERVRNAGRMALTNYLTQTILGLTMLGWLLRDMDLTRTMIAVWILGVWALQLWWSTAWLQRHRYGPFEWAWRSATYRSRQPLRRSRAATP
ncbi:MAG: DUF418 domain-containing protein [Nitriliruptoraceae bacterium]